MERFIFILILFLLGVIVAPKIAEGIGQSIAQSLYKNGEVIDVYLHD